MFEQLTEKYHNEREGFVLSSTELAELTLAAKDSRDVHPAVWAKFKAVLTNSGAMKAPAVASTYRECRITSDLKGVYTSHPTKAESHPFAQPPSYQRRQRSAFSRFCPCRSRLPPL